jgi:hypothetical protein
MQLRVGRIWGFESLPSFSRAQRARAGKTSNASLPAALQGAEDPPERSSLATSVEPSFREKSRCSVAGSDRSGPIDGIVQLRLEPGLDTGRPFPKAPSRSGRGACCALRLTTFASSACCARLPAAPGGFRTWCWEKTHNQLSGRGRSRNEIEDELAGPTISTQRHRKRTKVYISRAGTRTHERRRPV